MGSKLDKLEALEKAATAGPWKGDRYDGTVKYAIEGVDGVMVCHGCNGNSAGDNPYGFQRSEDDEFVMAIRNNAAALIAVARAAEKVVDAVEKQALNGIPMTPHIRAIVIMLRDALARLDGGE